MFRDVRSFFGRAARYMQSQNVNRFLVFGGGIPTLGTLHEAVPDAMVLYGDIDLKNVDIGKAILRDNPRCDYLYCDVTDLSTFDWDSTNTLLEAYPEIRLWGLNHRQPATSTQRSSGQIPHANERLGICIAGVVCFLEDDLLTKTFEQLYEMAPPNSYLAVDFDSFGMPADTVKKRKYMRRVPDTIRPLLGKWQPTPHGILPISLWQPDQPNVQDPGETVSHYTVVLTK